MKHPHSVLSFAVVAALAAQDPKAPSPAPAAPDALQQTATRLAKSFVATSALPSCSFKAHWGPTDKPEAAGGAQVVAVTVNGESPATGEAQGTWADGALHVALGDDELRFDGRAMLAKDATRDWTLRRGRFADGNEVDFVPDPQRLLAALRAMKLEVAHREAAALDDRPVEIVTVSLTPEQAAELAWSDLLPAGDGFFGGGFAQIIRGRMVVAGGGAQRPAATAPDTTVDLAFYLDPGSGLLHRVHVRSYRKAEGGGGGRMVFLAGGGGVRVQAAGLDDAEEEAEEPEAAEKAGAAPQFADGLPVRSKKKLIVADYVLDLKDHGSATLPELDAAAKALLGR